MKGRILFLVGLLGLGFVAVAGRLYSLQIDKHDHYLELAAKQHQRVVDLHPPRGTIYDAQGRELAVSVPSDSAYAVPREIEDPAAAAAALAPILGQDADELRKKLSGDGWFAWIARQLDPEKAQAVRDLGLEGIGFKEESRRYYPGRQLAANLLGFVGIDYHGLAGLEQRFEDEISGESRQRVMQRDAGGRYSVGPEQAFAEAEPGRDLYLTLDATIQHIVERELARTVDEYQAVGGSAVILDPQTGAVLAMASLPTFDPNRFWEVTSETRRNRVIADAFEPGSAFKVVTAAAALENNLVDPSDQIDCHNGRIVLHGVGIRDYKPFGVLTFREVITKSSNIGTLTVARRLGDREFFDKITAFGFGRRTGIELPGENPGILHPVESWQALTSAYVSFGQGVAATPIQLAASFAALANGGQLLQPYVVESISGPGEGLLPRPRVVGRVISQSTARQVGRLLEAVVEEGTAKQARLEGYRLAGKTSTAQIPTKGGYHPTDHFAVFAGYAPARRPTLVGVVVVDRPRSNIHGGAVSAPAFSRMARQILLYQGAPPSRERPSLWPGQVADLDSPSDADSGRAI